MVVMVVVVAVVLVMVMPVLMIVTMAGPDVAISAVTAEIGRESAAGLQGLPPPKSPQPPPTRALSTAPPQHHVRIVGLVEGGKS